MYLQLIPEENSSTSATVDRIQLSAVNRFWHQLGKMTQEDFSQASHLVFAIQCHDSLFRPGVCPTFALDNSSHLQYLQGGTNKAKEGI